MSTNLAMRKLTIQWLDSKAACSGEFPLGTTAAEALDALGIPKADIAAVSVNNEILPLSAPLVVNAGLRFIF